MRMSLDHRTTPYVFVLPLMLVLLLINFYPMAYSLVLSLSEWPSTHMLEGPTFAGLVNFQRMIADERLWNSVRFMLMFVLASVGLELVLGMGVALLLNQRLPARSLVRSLIILPIAMAPLVAGIAWRYLFNYDYGLVNYGLNLVGLPPVSWLSSLPWAQFAIILVDVWQNTPFVALVLLAGLQAIPDEYAEAARIDGASPWQLFWKITLPLLRPALLVAMIIRTTNTVRMFDLSFILTAGGPYQSTETFSFLAYREAFSNFQLPYAAAISWFIFLLNLIITVFFVRILFRRAD